MTDIEKQNLVLKPINPVGIIGYGAYVPRYRLPSAEVARIWVGGARGGPVKEKSVPGLDEDVITMSIEAARNALLRAEIDPCELRAVWVGSESHPYSVKPTSTIVAEAIGAVPSIQAGDWEFHPPRPKRSRTPCPRSSRAAGSPSCQPTTRRSGSPGACPAADRATADTRPSIQPVNGSQPNLASNSRAAIPRRSSACSTELVVGRSLKWRKAGFPAQLCCGSTRTCVPGGATGRSCRCGCGEVRPSRCRSSGTSTRASAGAAPSCTRTCVDHDGGFFDHQDRRYIRWCAQLPWRPGICCD